MKDIEPQIYRQRLVIEARYTIEVNRDVVKEYLIGLAKELGMTLHPSLPEPIITSATGKSNPIHDGYEGIVIWLESGASLYIWERSKFLTTDIYTCKPFDAKKAVDFVAKFFQTSELEYSEI
jgi:S-adenosylmethionine/arginine decarboxylase-like enzyme